jgi:hypothetical protein
MAKAALLVSGLLLVAFGSERLFYAATNRQQATVTCEAFAASPPQNLWLRVTGCEIDYIGAGFREWRGRIVELYFPARPAGWEQTRPAPIVATTSDPDVLALAETTIGDGRTPDQEQFLVMMLKIVTALRAARVIDGYAKATLLDRLSANNALTGLSTPISPDVVVIDLNAKPPVLVPAAATLAGVALLGGFFVLRSKRRAAKARAPVRTPAAAKTASAAPGVEPEHERSTYVAASRTPPPAMPPSMRLRVMLLNLPADAGPEAIEGAPPLGERSDVIALLSRIVAGLSFDAGGTGTINRREFQLTIDVGPTTPIYTVVLDARGAAALQMIKRILEQTRWRAFAARTGEFITPERLNESEPVPVNA